MTGLRGRAAVVGVADMASPTGELDLHGRALEVAVLKAALDDAGLTPGDVDGICYAGGMGMGSVQLAEFLGIRPTFTDSTTPAMPTSPFTRPGYATPATGTIGPEMRWRSFPPISRAPSARARAAKSAKYSGVACGNAMRAPVIVARPTFGSAASTAPSPAISPSAVSAAAGPRP